jgi:hypothetical protein
VYSVSPCNDGQMNDLWSRIAQVIEAKKVPNEAAWLKKAGLSNGFFSSRRAELKKGKVPSLGTKGAMQLAKAAGVRVEWLLSGTGPMELGATSPTVDQPSDTHLISEIARCSNASLREALAVFYGTNRSEPARHAITHFLYAQHKDLPKMGVDAWLDELRAYAGRVRKGLSPLGLGAQELEEDE